MTHQGYTWGRGRYVVLSVVKGDLPLLEQGNVMRPVGNIIPRIKEYYIVTGSAESHTKLQYNPHSRSCSLTNIVPGLRAILYARSNSARVTIVALIIFKLRTLMIYLQNIKSLRIIR